MNKFKLHPNYKQIPDNDIAILETEKIESKWFVPVCITSEETSLVGHRGNVLSWAPNSKQSQNEYDIQLLSSEFGVVYNSYCMKIANNVPNHTICINHGQRENWLCKGDSGAGFFIPTSEENVRKRIDRRLFLHGIVSSGVQDLFNDCTSQDYVIFTDVSKFYSFIVSDL